MDIAANEQLEQLLPDGYHSLYRISFNYRVFILSLADKALLPSDSKIIEVAFPWRESELRKNDNQDRFLSLIQKGVTAMGELSAHLSDMACHVFFLEVDPLLCTFSIATRQEQAIFKRLQDMPCPDVFDLPKISTLSQSPLEKMAG